MANRQWTIDFLDEDKNTVYSMSTEMGEGATAVDAEAYANIQARKNNIDYDYLNIKSNLGEFSFGHDKSKDKPINIPKEKHSRFNIEDKNDKNQPDSPKIQEKASVQEFSMIPGDPGKNALTTIMTVLAMICYIGAFISGIVFGRDYRGDFSFLGALVIWIAGFVGGTLYLAISYIIRSLDEIKNSKFFAYKNTSKNL